MSQAGARDNTVRDCQGFQKPQGSGVKVQEGRVGVGILYPHETLTLARGQGVCQGYVKGMSRVCTRRKFFYFAIFLIKKA